MKKNNKSGKVLSIILMILILVLISTIIYKVIANGTTQKDQNKDENTTTMTISVNSESVSNDITLNLENYIMDKNALIINYKVVFKNDNITFSDTEDNLIIDTFTEYNSHIDINSKTYSKQSENTYKFSTMYAIDQFSNKGDQIELNINISKISGISGDWNFKIVVNENYEKDIIKYSYNDITNFEITNRIPIKTNYTPIVIEVKDVCMTDFYGLMDINIYNNQNSIEDGRRLDPVKNINTSSDEYLSDNWNEVEPLTFEIKDEDGNTLVTYDYDYTRCNLIKKEKLLFPNKEHNYLKLTLNIYLNDKSRKTLAGIINLDLSNEYKKELYVLDTEQEIANGKIKFKTSSKWKFSTYEKSPKTFETMAVDKNNNNIELIFECDTEEDLEYYGVHEYTDIKDLTQKYTLCEMESFDESAIVDEGEETIGNFSGYQVTYYAKSNGVYYKSKVMYTTINNEIYAIKISANSERAYDNNLDFCEDIIRSIELY